MHENTTLKPKMLKSNQKRTGLSLIVVMGYCTFAYATICFARSSLNSNVLPWSSVVDSAERRRQRAKANKTHCLTKRYDS